MGKQYLLYIIHFLSLMVCFSQDGPLEFKHYSRQDGLSSTIVQNMAQDKDGFLWVCQNTGIHRFNGYYFENFNWVFEDVQYKAFTHLASGSRGELFIGTNSSGLIKYDPYNNETEQFAFDVNDPNSINANHVTFFFQDSRARNWVGTWYGLSEMTPDGNFISYPFNTEGSKKDEYYNVIEDIVETEDGTLWTATWGGGLHHFDPISKKFDHYEKLPNTDKNLWIKKITKKNKDQLLLATIDNGVLLFNIKDGTFDPIEYRVPSPNPGYKRCLDVKIIEENKLWIATEEGLIIYDMDSRITNYIYDQESLAYSLQNKSINGFFEDNHNGIWVFAGGLSYYNPKASKFKLYQSNSRNGSLSDNEIHDFLELDKNNIWVSTKKGINVWHRDENRFELINPFPETAYILKKWNNVVYAALPRKGLYSYNIKTKEKKEYHESTNTKTGLIDNHIRSMEFDKDGNLWIGNLKGLSVFRTSDEKFFHIMENKLYSKGLKAKTISSVAPTGQYGVWLLNNRSLLKLAHLDSDFLKTGGQSGVILDTMAYSFQFIEDFPIVNNLFSNDSNIYISTSKGFIVNNLQTDEQKIYRSIDGLASTNIAAIAVDQHDDVWLGGDNGLSYINLQTDEITNFYKKDGLQSNFFQSQSKLTVSSGEILMGGNNGFNSINIDDIELNPYVPPAVITGVQVYNRPVPVMQPFKVYQDNDSLLVTKNYSYLDEIVLEHNQNSITFELASLNFLYPEENELSYMIEGVDKDWNVIKNRRYVSYTNLPEGKQLTLNVKGSNNNGIWNPEAKKLKIFVTPPFYNTIWFRVLALSLLILIMVLAYRLRIKNLKQQRKKLEEEVTQRTKKIEYQRKEIEKQNKSLKEQSQDLYLQNKNIALFSEIGKQITSAISISDIFARTFGQIKSLIKTDHLAIGRRNFSEDTMLYWEMGSEKTSENKIALDKIKRISALALKENRIIISNDVKKEIHGILENPEDYYFEQPYQSVIYIPLNSKSKGTIGIFVAKSEQINAFTDRHVNLLEKISTYMTIALENAWAYDQIKDQSERLKELNRTKTRFYTNISHEFRTPLSLILGPAEEIAKNPKISVRDKEYLGIISQNARRMLRLVTQILDLSKLEDGVLKLTVSEGNINESIHNIVDSFQFMAKDKGVEFYLNTPDKPIIGNYDQDKIEKIAYNLLSNAFKYTDPGGKVTIKLTQEVDKNKLIFAKIDFVDTGVGIHRKDLQQIFNTYYRVENIRTQQQFGAGIGLSLVKKLVTLHHGVITVESNENRGSKFTVRIPISAESYSKTERKEVILGTTNHHLNMVHNNGKLQDRSDINIKKIGLKKLLIVEDNEDLLRFMVNLLEKKYEVKAVGDGAEAMDYISQTIPDLIISDVMMPRMNGFKLAQRIKKNPAYSHIPLILLTAKNSNDSQFEGLTHGADAYLIKPVNMVLLEKRIENLLVTYGNVRKKFGSKLVSDVDNLEVKNEHEKFLKNVLEILEVNITNSNINIDFFTERLGISRTLLYEKIKKATGESMGVFIRKNRLNYAAKLLLENHYNTSELAYEVGFSDPKYFSKCFRKQFGKTPKDYLKEKLNIREQ